MSQKSSKMPPGGSKSRLFGHNLVNKSINHPTEWFKTRFWAKVSGKVYLFVQIGPGSGEIQYFSLQKWGQHTMILGYLGVWRPQIAKIMIFSKSIFRNIRLVEFFFWKKNFLVLMGTKNFFFQKKKSTPQNIWKTDFRDFSKIVITFKIWWQEQWGGTRVSLGCFWSRKIGTP